MTTRMHFDAQLFALAVALYCATPSAAQTTAGDLTPDDAQTIEAGHYVWRVKESTEEPVRIVVSIADQRAYVYQGTRIVGISAVSTGKEGHETPTGTFRILQKAVTHRSNKYDNASMPYMERITWDGVALHAGHDPGFPNSHGCVRLPAGFAKKLYAVTRLGSSVTITDDPVGGELAPSIDASVDTTTVVRTASASTDADRASPLPAPVAATDAH